MTIQISPKQLQDFIYSQEMTSREGTVPGVSAQTIFRYGGFVGSNIQSFSKLDRAMDSCRSHIEQMEKERKSVASGTIMLADSLNSSKGRFDRVWHAPEGGLWGCMILVNTFLSETLNFLPLALGVSCCEAIRQTGVNTAVIRWVNDVLIDKKKVGGFLVEGYRSSQGLEEYSLVGFGINVVNETFPRELGSMAISLSQALGHSVDLGQFGLCYLAKLSWNIGLICYEEQQKLTTGKNSGHNGSHLLLEKWKQLSDTIGKRVVYGYDVVEKPQYQAKVTNILNDGSLLMRLDDGCEIIEHGGEIRYLAG